VSSRCEEYEFKVVGFTFRVQGRPFISTRTETKHGEDILSLTRPAYSNSGVPAEVLLVEIAPSHRKKDSVARRDIERRYHKGRVVCRIVIK